MTLSVTIIAANEAHRIGRCLEALRFCDEVVVVIDDRTTDATAEVARAHGARVLVRTFDGFPGQRRFADEQATGEWILSVDCDEVVSETLADEIRATLEAPRFAAYRVPHLDYMFGRWIRHGGWYPQYHVRLYRRDAASWERDVHERVGVRGAIGTLAHPILHFSHRSVEDWVNKMARYTSVEARALHRAGRRAGLLQVLVEPFLYFGYKYFVQQGFRDGWHGLVLALLLGAYRMVVYLKLWDLAQSQRGPVEREDCLPSISRS